MKYMQQQDEKRDEQHKQIVTSIGGLATTTSELKTAIETEKTQRESEVNELCVKIESIEKRMDDFKPPWLGEEANDESTRQIIARGFDRDTDAADMCCGSEHIHRPGIHWCHYLLISGGKEWFLAKDSESWCKTRKRQTTEIWE